MGAKLKIEKEDISDVNTSNRILSQQIKKGKYNHIGYIYKYIY